MMEAKIGAVEKEVRIKVIVPRTVPPMMWDDLKDSLIDVAHYYITEFIRDGCRWGYHELRTDIGHPRAYWVIFRDMGHSVL